MVDVLEVGCFDGYVLHNLQEKGYNVTGCDPSIGADIGKSFGINIQKGFEVYAKNPGSLEEESDISSITISYRRILNHIIDALYW